MNTTYILQREHYSTKTSFFVLKKDQFAKAASVLMEVFSILETFSGDDLRH